MRRWIGTAAAFCMITVLLACIVTAQEPQAGSLSFSIGGKRTCSLTISYQDGSDGTVPVAGAGFVCYRAAGYEMNVSPVELLPVPAALNGKGKNIEISDRTDVKKVEAEITDAYANGRTVNGRVYRAETGADGKAVIQNMEPGIYLVKEEKSVKYHLPSASFLVSIPSGEGDGMQYDIKAEPKPEVTGDLVIKKTVKGNAGEKERLFHFQITLRKGESYAWTRSDGAGGTLQSGGTISLKHGESVTVSGIPAGTSYTVSEKEADQDGYKTESTGIKGKIKGKKQQTAAFVNTRTESKAPPASSKKTKTTQGVKTGDQSRTELYLLLAGISFFGMIVLKKRRKESV
ncbi:MAG: DUF5979 domain-containing protein [Lachnospiraceae bacterium]|nr:DUF5979 domain-containing protein [Lachnospiraceae bacterium]